MKYTKEFRDYWQLFCDDEYWKDKPISISQESLSTLLDEIDRLTSYAHRLLSDESRTWHCEGCGHNFTSKAMAEGKRPCPLCDAPMRPMSEIRQERIAELEAELEKHRWMPASEPPKRKGNFLVTNGESVIEETWYGTEWGCSGVTLWQNFPEPPKEGE